VNYIVVYLHIVVMSNVSEGYAVFNMYRHISMKSFVLKQHAVLISWMCYAKFYLKADKCMLSNTFFKSVRKLHNSLLEVRLQFVTLVTLKHVDKFTFII
jgi:hypothetical protein